MNKPRNVGYHESYFDEISQDNVSVRLEDRQSDEKNEFVAVIVGPENLLENGWQREVGQIFQPIEIMRRFNPQLVNAHTTAMGIEIVLVFMMIVLIFQVESGVLRRIKCCRKEGI